MKSYSSESITKSQVDAIDAKQTDQIKKLRIWLAVSFVANAALTIALHFLA